MTAPITWAEASSPILWSNIGIDWNSPAKTGDPTFALSQGITPIAGKLYTDSITFAAASGFTDSGALTVNP